MLFDPRPKRRRDDLFNREKEIEKLHNFVNDPITILTGIRRIGKNFGTYCFPQ